MQYFPEISIDKIETSDSHLADDFREAIFNLPFSLYKIQKDVINILLKVLKDGSIGIIESPTGTGKTLSILLSVIHWLRKHEVDLLLEKSECNEKKISGWLRDSILLRKKTIAEEYISQRRKIIYSIQKVGRDLLFDIKHNKSQSQLDFSNNVDDKKSSITRNSVPEKIQYRIKKLKYDLSLESKCQHENSGVDDFLLNVNGELSSRNHDSVPLLTQIIDIPLSQIGENFRKTQIFICSRTHSQLQQYIKEIISLNLQKYFDVAISLASRKQLCVNSSVNKPYFNISQINDRCSDLLRSNDCEYKLNSDKLLYLSMSEVLDIENIFRYGSDTKLLGCPYYATRQAAKYADIVFLPYSCLLNQSTRESLGIDIHNSVIVIDEAHNLSNALCDANSSILPFKNLNNCQSVLKRYTEKYSRRLNNKNSFFIVQLIEICQNLNNFTSACKEAQCMPVSKFLLDSKLQKFELHDLIRWFSDSFIKQKLYGFELSIREREDLLDNNDHNGCSGIYNICDFIEKLLCSTKSDFVFCHPGSSPCEIDGNLELTSFMPEEHFDSIVKSCRSLILIGGTMKPFEEFVDLCNCDGLIDQKTPFYDGIRNQRTSISKSKMIHCYSAGHVVPKSHIFTSIITHFRGEPLDFRFSNRQNTKLIFNLIDIILEMSKIVPKGIVVFFPSFDFLEFFEKTAFSKSFDKNHSYEFSSYYEKVNELKIIKKLFFEKKQKKGSSCRSSEETFNLYAEHIKGVSKSDGKTKFENGDTGAILFTVMGGKLSEGINFNDDLARCVCVIGLPYPNEDFKLKKKIEYISQNLNSNHNIDENKQLLNATQESVSFRFSNKSSRDIKKIICLKKINQSVGRAIRHKDDFASIILIDQRFADSSIVEQLPGWVRNRILVRKEILHESVSILEHVDNDCAISRGEIINLDVKDIFRKLSEFYRVMTC